LPSCSWPGLETESASWPSGFFHGGDMIQFRCWFCSRRYKKPEQEIGKRFTCSCDRLLRVPKRSGGNCRCRTPTDWLVEALVYGGGGALLGLGLALVLLSRLSVFGHWSARYLIPGLTVIGFLAGLLGGERGINFVGEMIRDRENR